MVLCFDREWECQNSKVVCDLACGRVVTFDAFLTEKRNAKQGCFTENLKCQE